MYFHRDLLLRKSKKSGTHTVSLAALSFSFGYTGTTAASSPSHCWATDLLLENKQEQHGWENTSNDRQPSTQWAGWVNFLIRDSGQPPQPNVEEGQLGKRWVAQVRNKELLCNGLDKFTTQRKSGYSREGVADLHGENIHGYCSRTSSFVVP